VPDWFRNASLDIDQEELMIYFVPRKLIKLLTFASAGNISVMKTLVHEHTDGGKMVY